MRKSLGKQNFPDLDANTDYAVKFKATQLTNKKNLICLISPHCLDPTLTLPGGSHHLRLPQRRCRAHNDDPP